MVGDNQRHRRLTWAVIAAGYLAAGAVPLAVAVVRPGITGYHRALLQDMVHGRAHEPFVKRQLVPQLVRIGLACTPESVDERLREIFGDSRLVARLRWPPAYAPEFVITLLIMYASTVAFLGVLRRLLLACLEMPRWPAHAAVLAVGVCLPVCYAGQVYIYDYTQLLLFTLGLLLMLRGRWWVYYPVYALACLNKETSILLPVVLAAWKGRAALRPPYLLSLAAQGAIGVGICAALSAIYRGNPGGATEWHLMRNVTFSFSALGWVRIGVLLIGIVLAGWRFREAPVFLRRGLLATLPLLLAATLPFGYIDELRDYYEAVPFAVGLGVLTLGWRFGVRARSEP